MGQEDLREFTLLSLDTFSNSTALRSPLDSSPTTSSNRHNGSSFFTMVAEGAGKAFNSILTAGEQLLGVNPSSDSAYFEVDLARRTRNEAAHQTQRFLNSMLIA